MSAVLSCALLVATAAARDVSSSLDGVVLVQQGSTTCAGALIEPAGTVLTAYHCVAPGGRPAVTDRQGRRAIGRVRAVDVARDLALIDVPDLAGPASLVVSTRLPAPGEPVWALGHPAAADPPGGFLEGTLRWSAGAGAVSAVGSRAVQVSAPLNPGNSGGPVVDAEGQVVGVASRRLSGDNLGFAGRVDGVPELASRPRRGLSPLGGTVAIEGLLLSQDGPESALAVGARLQVALRDRLVVDAGGLLPASPRWTAARFGATTSSVAELRGGLRQRLGRGSYALRLDAWGGVAALQRWSRPPDDPLALTTATRPAPIVGGTLRARGVGLELGWVPGEETLRTGIVLGVPGVVSVF